MNLEQYLMRRISTDNMNRYNPKLAVYFDIQWLTGNWELLFFVKGKERFSDRSGRIAIDSSRVLCSRHNSPFPWAVSYFFCQITYNLHGHLLRIHGLSHCFVHFDYLYLHRA